MLASSLAIAGARAPLPERKPAAPGLSLYNSLEYAGSLLGLASFSAEEPGDHISALMRKASAQELNARPLSKSDAAHYKAAFEAQREGDIETADEHLAAISDLRLMGHVLGHRYLHVKSYRSSFEELQGWLSHYADHPDAARIYRLAQSRAPKGYKGEIPKPAQAASFGHIPEPTMRSGKTYVSKRARTPGEKSQAASAQSRSLELARADRYTEALSLLDANVAVLDSTEYDIARAEIAAAALYGGHPATAGALAVKSLQRSGAYVPKAAWVAGLVYWREGDYAAAARYFEIAARSPYASGWTLASGAYWAARANMRLGDVKDVSNWLSVGMDNPRTFYGLISTRALGRDFDFNWKLPTFTAGYRSVLARIPAGARAMALVEAGQVDLAQSELLRVSPSSDEERNALLAYAGYANLPGLGMRIASALAGPQDNYDSALYPHVPWEPAGGLKVDPALLHAIMRQESKFDPEAESPMGARGLMQLMPSTARRVAGEDLDLADPHVNLEIGQRYIERLMSDPAVKGDLFMLMIAYNAGPGNLAKWRKRWPDVKDPLLFIELIPSAETRSYVERVLANYWIYRMKEEKPVPSLDSVASGQSAKYSQASL